MRSFTKTEIDLCKKIAKKEKKFVGEGDWIVFIKAQNPKPVIWLPQYKNIKHSYFAIWQIHDCLEWLRKRGFYMYRIAEWLGGRQWQVTISNPEELAGYRNKDCLGQTLLEALLRAVLAILENK